MEIIEGNKLIAEFMGYEPRIQSWRGMKDNTTYKINERWFPNWTLQYHTSWDWLMPVVEKICEIDNQADVEFALLRNSANLEIFKTSILCHIDGVYERVIQFIKWYNQIQ